MFVVQSHLVFGNFLQQPQEISTALQYIRNVFYSIPYLFQGYLLFNFQFQLFYKRLGNQVKRGNSDSTTQVGRFLFGRASLCQHTGNAATQERREVLLTPLPDPLVHKHRLQVSCMYSYKNHLWVIKLARCLGCPCSQSSNACLSCLYSQFIFKQGKRDFLINFNKGRNNLYCTIQRRHNGCDGNTSSGAYTDVILFLNSWLSKPE